MAAKLIPLNAIGGQEIRPLPYSDVLSLTANTAKSYTIPAGTQQIVFEYLQPLTTALWVNMYGGTAAIPSTDLSGGNNAFKVTPGVAYNVSQITSISIVSSANKILSLQCYGDV